MLLFFVKLRRGNSLIYSILKFFNLQMDCWVDGLVDHVSGINHCWLRQVRYCGIHLITIFVAQAFQDNDMCQRQALYMLDSNSYICNAAPRSAKTNDVRLSIKLRKFSTKPAREDFKKKNLSETKQE